MRTRERSDRATGFVERTSSGLRALLALFLLMASIPSELSGQTTAPIGSPIISPNLAAKLQERGDLTLSDTTLRQAIFMISDSWKINLVVGQGVDGMVNGVFQDAPLHEILDSILFANGFGYQVVGEGLVIMPRENLNEINPMFETATIVLRAVAPQDLAESAKLLSSPQGKLEVIESARALLVIDLPEHVQRIRTFVNQLEQSAAGAIVPLDTGPQLELVHFAPQYVSASDIRESVETLLGESGKAAVVETENRLIVVDFPDRLALVEQMVAKLDTPRPQVRITALIYDISLEDLEELGINWSHAAKARYDGANPTREFSLDSVLVVPTAPGNPGSVLTLMNLSRHLDLTTVVSALSSCNRSRLLADPTVTVMDREEASISIVTEIPFQELTQTAEGGSIGTTNFKEAGVVLTVTPQIANDGTIRLNVTPTFSRLAGFTGGTEPQPIINKREASTSVRVCNQQTLIIGGLKQRATVDERNGVPYLKDIQFLHLGKLFRAYDVRFEESELVVFITPEIVTPVYSGFPREQMAHHVGRTDLNRVYAARESTCRNPFCAPHPQFVNETPYPSEVEMLPMQSGGAETESVSDPAAGTDWHPAPIIPIPDEMPPPMEQDLEHRSSRRNSPLAQGNLFRLAPVSAQPPPLPRDRWDLQVGEVARLPQTRRAARPDADRRAAISSEGHERPSNSRLPHWVDQIFRR